MDARFLRRSAGEAPLALENLAQLPNQLDARAATHLIRAESVAKDGHAANTTVRYDPRKLRRRGGDLRRATAAGNWLRDALRAIFASDLDDAKVEHLLDRFYPHASRRGLKPSYDAGKPRVSDNEDGARVA